MFRLLRRKTKGMVSMEPPIRNHGDMSNKTYYTPNRPINQLDSKMARLMELISCAIEDWAVEYHLENLPKKIVFEQALDAMKAIDFAMNSEER